MAWSPRDEKPAALFRRLLQMPRPTWPVAHLLGGDRDARMHVVGLRALDVASARSVGMALDAPGDVQFRAAAFELAAAGLRWDDGGELVAASADELGALPGQEADALVAATLDALARVTPSLVAAELGNWLQALAAGAEANPVEAWALGSQSDVAWGPGVHHFAPRPDRYFGQPLGQLCDAHWRAFWAARQFVVGQMKR